MRLRTRKLAAFATCLGIAAADKGGVPNGDKPCPAKQAKKHPKKPAPNMKGKKCGFQGETTTATGTA